jgi:hypothetical protein
MNLKRGFLPTVAVTEKALASVYSMVNMWVGWGQ